jgi:hypothetical protein
VKKFKRKSFLLVEILFGIALFILVYSYFAHTPLSLYKALKINQKKVDLFVEKKRFLHDLMEMLQEKKVVKNGDEYFSKNYKNWAAKAQIVYEIEPENPYCKLRIKMFFTDKQKNTFEEDAILLIKIKK